MIQVLQGTKMEKLNKVNYKIIEIFKKFKTVEIANAVMSRFNPLKEFMKLLKNIVHSKKN